jgi:hypothetical protein
MAAGGIGMPASVFLIQMRIQIFPSTSKSKKFRETSIS